MTSAVARYDEGLCKHAREARELMTARLKWERQLRQKELIRIEFSFIMKNIVCLRPLWAEIAFGFRESGVVKIVGCSRQQCPFHWAIFTSQMVPSIYWTVFPSPLVILSIHQAMFSIDVTFSIYFYCLDSPSCIYRKWGR